MVARLLLFSVFLVILCFAFGDTKRSGCASTALLRLAAGQVDGAECLFVFEDIILQGEKQALGVFGSQYDAALYIGFGHTREHSDEVEHHFCARMSDDGQVGIDTFGYFGRQLDLQLSFFVGIVLMTHIVLYL